MRVTACESGFRYWLLTRGQRDRRLERRSGLLLVVIAILLACWAVWLGSSLPPDPLPQQWSTAWLGLDNYSLTWVGLDCLEVLGLAGCGLAFCRGSAAARTFALLTVPVFVLDAWFDILSSVSRADLTAAVVMAAAGELPAVAGLAWVAWKAAAFGTSVQVGQLHQGQEEVIDLPDRVDEPVEVSRLADVGVRVQRVAAQDVLVRLRGGQHHDRDPQ